MIQNGEMDKELERYEYMRQVYQQYGTRIFPDFVDLGPLDRQAGLRGKLQLFILILESNFCTPVLKQQYKVDF